MLKMDKVTRNKWIVALVGLLVIELYLSYINRNQPITEPFMSFGRKYNKLALTPIVFILILYLSAKLKYFQRNERGAVIAFSFLLIGFLSNSFSKVVYGRVIDYIPLPWGRTNLADIGVIISILYLSVNLFQDKKIAPDD